MIVTAMWRNGALTGTSPLRTPKIRSIQTLPVHGLTIQVRRPSDACVAVTGSAIPYRVLRTEMVERMKVMSNGPGSV